MSITGSALAGSELVPRLAPIIVVARIAVAALRTVQTIVLPQFLDFIFEGCRIGRSAEIYTGPLKPCLPDPWQEPTRPREVPAARSWQLWGFMQATTQVVMSPRCKLPAPLLHHLIRVEAEHDRVVCLARRQLDRARNHHSSDRAFPCLPEHRAQASIDHACAGHRAVGLQRD